MTSPREDPEPAVGAPRKAEPTRPAPRLSWRRRIVTAFAILGPGLIAANAGNDAGGIATYASCC